MCCWNFFPFNKHFCEFSVHSQVHFPGLRGWFLGQVLLHMHWHVFSSNSLLAPHELGKSLFLQTHWHESLSSSLYGPQLEGRSPPLQTHWQVSSSSSLLGPQMSWNPSTESRQTQAWYLYYTLLGPGCGVKQLKALTRVFLFVFFIIGLCTNLGMFLYKEAKNNTNMKQKCSYCVVTYFKAWWSQYFTCDFNMKIFVNQNTHPWHLVWKTLFCLPSPALEAKRKSCWARHLQMWLFHV